MTDLNAALSPLGKSDFWFSPKGRVPRLPYFAGLLLAGLTMQLGRVVQLPFVLFTIPVTLLCLYVSFVLAIKRAHDRNRSGWFVLLYLVPLVQLWPTIELLFFRGTVGPNRFGAVPPTSDVSS